MVDTTLNRQPDVTDAMCRAAIDGFEQGYRSIGRTDVPSLYGYPMACAVQAALDVMRGTQPVKPKPIPVCEVYAAIDSERDYAERKWGERGDDHEIATWITYMRHYLNEAERIAATAAPATPALDPIRKVANLAVACMIQHGAPHRVMP